MRTASALAALGILLAAFVPAGTAAAQEKPPGPPLKSAGGETELAKETQNPVASLVNIPFQTNFYSGGDLRGRTSIVLNVQPVAPIRLTPRWNLISRTVAPWVSVPLPGGGRASGIGDVQEQLFLTPARPGSIIWGVGPVLSFPTATAQVSETGSWAAGPNAVVLVMSGPWVVGALANQLWTYSDTGGSPETNAFLLQYFVNYNLARGWALSSSPAITANWDAPAGDKWTVPFGAGISKTTVLRTQPLQLNLHYYYNVERPTGTGDSQIRFSLSLLYPTMRPPPPK